MWQEPALFCGLSLWWGGGVGVSSQGPVAWGGGCLPMGAEWEVTRKRIGLPVNRRKYKLSAKWSHAFLVVLFFWFSSWLSHSLLSSQQAPPQLWWGMTRSSMRPHLKCQPPNLKNWSFSSRNCRFQKWHGWSIVPLTEKRTPNESPKVTVRPFQIIESLGIWFLAPTTYQTHLNLGSLSFLIFQVEIHLIIIQK